MKEIGLFEVLPSNELKCVVCGRVIISEAGQAVHARMHIRKGEAVANYKNRTVQRRYLVVSK